MRKLIIALLLTMPVMAMAKPTYYAQTNHFALKQGQDWSWGQVAKTPNIKWEHKTPKQQKWDNGVYYDTYGYLGEYGNFNVLGTKNKPVVIHFYSSQLYKESESGEDVYTLHQLFNKSELTKVKSNCSVDSDTGRMATGEYQHFYKWQKKGYQPLYLGVRRFVAGTFAGGIIMNYVIVKDFNDFNNNLYIHTAIEGYDANGNEIACRILK